MKQKECWITENNVISLLANAKWSDGLIDVKQLFMRVWLRDGGRLWEMVGDGGGWWEIVGDDGRW